MITTISTLSEIVFRLAERPDNAQPNLRRFVLTACLLALLQFAAALPLSANGAAGEISLEDPGVVTRLTLTVDKSRTIRLGKPFREALVASPDIADIAPLTDHSIYVIGKKIGTTRLTLVAKEGHLLGVIEIEVAYDAEALRRQLRETIPGAAIRVKTVNGRILLLGTAPDSIALSRALAIAEQYAPQAVTNSLSVRASQQVLLEVRFIEAQRSAARDLGISWDVVASRFTAMTGLGGLPSNSTPFGVFIATLLDGGAKADLIIQALEQRGLARRLAEPNLVALSGDTANFLAGGEFPFPVQADNNKITIEFKKFGVSLAFTPTVLAGGQINLKIEPEVSDLDPTNTLTVSGVTIPGLVVRRAQTTVELRDGQGFAIAGLLQANQSRNTRELPWIARTPVLGALFRSASYEKRESDLVIIVTPRLVKPAIPGEKLLTPLDQSLASNDADFFLKGRLEVEKHRETPYGHIIGGAGGWRTELARRRANDAAEK